jgi:hypothetical protein
METPKPSPLLSKVHSKDEPSTDQPVNTSKFIPDDFNIEDVIGDFTD